MKLDIEQLINQGLIVPDEGSVVYNGTLSTTNNVDLKFKVTNGWDILAAHKCDLEWKAYRYKLAEHLQENYDGETLKEVLGTIQVEDAHWKWLDKSFFYNSDEYQWYFLKTSSDVEAVCLTYHPKASELYSGNIFYIEFIAVAPWNRDDPMEQKRFKSLGSLLMRIVINYSVTKLGLTYGFSLHSLPQANGFYKRIGMTHCKNADKDSLEYFEMDVDSSMKFVGVL
ncbi:hypothetical protein ACROAK_03130 [Shewanella oncorhynchi]|uniref:hypothetical protein n=1 Tax=Shewanella oncorhynchi TaxID=2726434 RepID=UPI003D7A6C6E